MARESCNFAYDVFLSFRGEDTKHKFTGYLHRELEQKGINTFTDDDNILLTGESISSAISKAIEESKNKSKFRQTRMEEENREDDINIRVITSSDPTSSLSHEQTPVEATQAAASLHNENTWMNVMTLEEYKGSLIPYLYENAAQGFWNQAKLIYDEFPDMLSVSLNDSGDTALHVAVSAFQIEYVENLVERMNSRDLEIQNTDGNTAFIMATITGNEHLLQMMITKNNDLALIRRHDGMLPVHLVASGSLRQILRHLWKEDLLGRMDIEDIKRLFFILISNRKYNRAKQLFDKYPDELAFAKDDQEQLTALHMLARMLSEKFASMTDQLVSSKDMPDEDYSEAKSEPHQERELFVTLWDRVRLSEYRQMVKLISTPSVVLFDLVKSQYIEGLKYVLSSTPQLLSLKDPDNGRSLLHYAALYRQSSLFKFILEMKTVNLIIQDVDKGRNNVLHFAALQPEASSSLTSDIHLQRELGWFKEVEKKVPSELRIMRNKEGKTPDDLFYAKRIKFSDDVKEATQGIANSGIVVATLIVRVAFAAALAVPRDKSNARFIVFHLSNAIALFTSAASIISFLIIFTSRFIEKEFIVPLHSSLILGLTSLFISIINMVTAFCCSLLCDI